MSRIVLALLVSVSLAACGGSTAARPAPSQSPTQSSGPAATRALCFAAPPADWAASMSSTVATLPGVNFGPMAVDETNGIVYGFFATASQKGIAGVDLRSGKLSAVSTMTAAQSGVIWSSYSDPWLVWVQGESQYTLGAWTIQAWNRQTGERLGLGSSRLPDGTYLENELVFPVVGHGYVAWNQPTSNASVDLTVYRFETRQDTTLDSGVLSSPVFASSYLVWAKIPSGEADASLKFVDADSLQPVRAPAELTRPSPVNYLAGSPGYVLWIANAATASDYRLTVDELATGRLTSYHSDASHFLQFPMVAGHYLAWTGPSATSIVDLSTGAGVDVSGNASVAATGDSIVIGRIAPSATKGAVTATTLSVIHPSMLSRLAPCAA